MNVTLSAALGYGVTTIDNIKLKWIGVLIEKLIGGIGIIGVGIIVFTIILKTIVLPLDIYSRIKGKKQALIMERMRPQMEKLQKQYADDKNMYNQKVLELQRASGYSMFGACLPMIVSLVIFIIVFQAFSTYSQVANINQYNNMVNIYNEVVQSYVIDITDDFGEPIKIVEGNGEEVIKTNADGFLYECILNTPNKEEGIKAEKDYTVDYDKFAAFYCKDREIAFVSTEDAFIKLAEEYQKNNTGYVGSFDKNAVNPASGQPLTDTNMAVRNTLVSYCLEEPAAKRVYEYYTGTGEFEGEPHNNHFLWVKNLWYPDSTLNKEVPEFSKFKSTVTKASISDDYATSYNKVTAALGTQKGKANGYFILIILSIGLMLVQQLISMKANKSVNDLSTVDGSGAKTNKWMLIMMPVIYGIFSFFYSASFSLYMITNTIYGLVTMLIINKSVDVWFKKKEEAGKLDEILAKKKKKTKKAGAQRRVR